MVKLNFTLADLVPQDEAQRLDPRRERVHQLHETVFGRLGPTLRNNGWSCFPQQNSERRKPAVVDRVTLKWKPFQHRLPSEAEMRSWSLQCPDENVAIITGTASSDLFALDVDVNDFDLAWAVREAANENMGATPFLRFGRVPRVVMLFRHQPDSRMRKRTYQFGHYREDGTWAASGDALEFLANGSPFTAYGRHHKTGDYFKWPDAQPFLNPPTDAPLVTPEQIEAFLAAVQDVRRFYRKAATLQLDQTSDLVDVGGMRVPNLRGGPDSQWTEDEAGLVVDGREQFLYRLVKQTIWANRDVARDTGGEGLRRIQAIVTEHFKQRTVLDGRWDESFLRQEVEEKTTREQQNFLERDKGRGVRVDVPVARMEEVQPPERPKVEGADSLSFLPVADGTGAGGERRDVRAALAAARTDEAAAARRLSPDRTVIAARVQDQVVGALRTFFDEVYDPAGPGARRVHVLRAPTGAGKTTRTLRFIAEDPRTKAYDAVEAVEPDGDGEEVERPGPVLFLMPTYNNIEELRVRADALNLDPTLDDAGLAAQARELGLVPADQFEVNVEEYRRDAMNAGLRVMLYKGKARAGCKVMDKLELLMGAGIGTSGLCKAQVDVGPGQKEERFCPHYVGCPAIEQRKEIARSHLVFMAHAFFTLKIPDELQGARCVVADERVFHLFVHTATFHRNTLRLARKEPRLTKKEKEAGLSSDVLVQDREHVAEKVTEFLHRGDCPALALHRYAYDVPGGPRVTGIELVRNAKRVCGNALTGGSAITPEMSLEAIRELCLTPTGTQIREEWRFWQILEERIDALVKDEVNARLHAEARAKDVAAAAEAAARGVAHEPAAGDPPDRLARGDREHRIQLLKEPIEGGGVTEKIRLSWRSKPNWAGRPLLLLDASSPPEVIRKIFDNREVVTHEVEAALNVRTVVVVDRTYSNASVVSGPGHSSKDRLIAGRTKNQVRNAISAISGLYGWGRVVAGSSVVVRRAINTAWKQPTNVDWCHFGAMRGLDFAKHHAAAISVGRMEVPIPVIDGLVGALTYDDPEPEAPFDVRGDLKSGEGEAVDDLKLPNMSQVVKMRSGEDVYVNVPCFPGRWARIMQQQYREEELSQFLGRLRPVYRSGEAPVWFALSRVLPDHVVVDELVTLDDLVMKSSRRRLTRVKLWEGLRCTGGVVHAALMEAACPHLFKSAKDADTEIRRHGLCPDTGAAGMDVRASWGLTPARLRGPDGSWSFVYVRTDIRDPVPTLVRAFARYLGLAVRPEDVVMGEPVRPAVASGTRAVDWVDEQIGSPEARARQESQAMSDAAVWSFVHLPKEAFTIAGRLSPVSPVPISTGDHPEVPGLSLTTFDIAAARSTDDMWATLAAGSAPVGEVKVVTPPAQFDHVGASSHDADD